MRKLTGRFGPGLPVLLTLLLWLASFAFCYALLTTPVLGDNRQLISLTESYGALDRVALWQRALSWFPGGHPDGSFITWPRWVITWTVRVAMTTMFALHAAAFFSAWRAQASKLPMLRWLIGPIGAQVIMLLMVPSNADIFFYEISGDIANRGLNPYTTHLYEVFQHLIYPYNHWIDMTTVYGPVWTLINQVLMAITGPDPTTATLLYKIVFGIVAIMLAVGVYLSATALGIRQERAAAAMVLVAWQPNMIIAAAGQGHNDVVMIALALMAVMLTILGASRATRGGIILLVLSAAVKYVTLPVLGLLELTRLGMRDRRHALLHIARAWTLDLLAVIAVLVGVFTPYWAGTETLAAMVSEPARLYANPVWFIPKSIIRVYDRNAASVFADITTTAAQGITVAVILIALGRFGMTAWHRASAESVQPGDLPYWAGPLLAGWALIFTALAFIPVNIHPWYWTWPVVPIALVVTWDDDNGGSPQSRHRWFVPWLALTAALTLVYHTRIVHPG